jgi:hypothetical protein
MANTIMFLPRLPSVTVKHMRAWALKASNMTAGECSRSEDLIEYMRCIERDNRRCCEGK